MSNIFTRTFSGSFTVKLSVTVSTSLSISLDDEGNPCVESSIEVSGGGFSEEFKLPKVCLTEQGVCSDVNSGGGDIRAEARICWAGEREVCADIVGKVKIFGRWYDDTYQICQKF
ncbi:MAG: hypothetical protein WGN25_20640 [Candidatus Electrothrix sp. GW3-4]|uniref:hypothetical protein n=1 Tax=Candidatus Electrothrix sp. GW3-4 TaxID=3126740 RepID=UPI0030D10690